MATENLTKLDGEELLTLQQKLGEEKGLAAEAFKEKQRAIQYELDKRAAVAQFGDLTPAQLEALAEVQARKATAESEE